MICFSERSVANWTGEHFYCAHSELCMFFVNSLTIRFHNNLRNRALSANIGAERQANVFTQQDKFIMNSVTSVQTRMNICVREELEELFKMLLL